LQNDFEFEETAVTYDLEQSFDGILFKTIRSGQLSGSKTGGKYRMEIEQPNGIAYYRMKIQNSYGAYVYTSVISANNKCNTIDILSLYPNPVTNKENIHLRFKTMFSGKAEVVIYNSIGQKILNKPIEFTIGINTIEIETKNFINGAYHISVISASGNTMSSAKTFIKQ
jgi:hypothetical protein